MKHQQPEELNEEAAYHFIAYVPTLDRVWEMDGLKSMPLEVGPLPHSVSGSEQEAMNDIGWLSVVQPALRRKMATGESVMFSLLAIVEDRVGLILELELLNGIPNFRTVLPSQ